MFPRKYWRSACLVVLGASLSACGPVLQRPPVSRHLVQEEAQLQRDATANLYIDRLSRLQRIYNALRIANADLCGSHVSPVTGLSGVDRTSLPAGWNASALRQLDGVLIVDVATNSAAAAAGLLAGDVIAGVAKGAGVIPHGGTWSGLTIPDLAKVIEGLGNSPMTLLVRRSGRTFPIVLTPQLGCRYPIYLTTEQAFRAYSDGVQIVLSSGLFNDMTDDRHVAVVVGHELAHLILEHRKKKEGNAAIGGAAGLLFDIGLLALRVNTQGELSRMGINAGAQAYSQEFEFEADYLSLYMLARAGLDISAGPQTFRVFGEKHPASQVKSYGATHPSTPERAVMMQQTLLEIQGKLSRNESIIPQIKPGEMFAGYRTGSQSSTIAVAATTPAPPAPQVVKATAPMTTAFAPALPAAAPMVPTAVTKPSSFNFAQLFLIRGPIVSKPPQRYSAKFYDTGKAVVMFPGRRLTGNFQTFALSELIGAKYTARLIKPDSVKLSLGANAKGFAALSDGTGTELECSYSFAKATGRGQGMCVDNQSNTYQIVFD